VVENDAERRRRLGTGCAAAPKAAQASPIASARSSPPAHSPGVVDKIVDKPFA